MKKIVIFLLSITMITGPSCMSTKKTAYFQGVDDKTFELVAEQYQVRIAPNDNLYITVSSGSAAAVEMFNSANPSRANITEESLSVMGYVVDNEGNINYPVLGKVHLQGMTRNEAVSHLSAQISKYVVDPIVNIRFLNYKVTVLGEVNQPGTFTIRDERVSIPEALGMAGDMTIYGKRNNVLICRETDGVKTFHRLDMTSADVFTSEYYYLRQNDVVYVQPNRARAGSSAYSQNLTLGLSAASLIATIISFLVTK